MPANTVCSISTGLPVMFLEARLHGSNQSLLSQLGFSIDLDHCSIALFTRTSGIVLVAGVSSYLAYRIFTKVLGNRFLWTIVDFARVDFLNRADVRLFRHKTEGNYRGNGRSFSVREEGSYSEWDSFYDDHFSDSTEVTFLSPESSPVRCCRWVVAHSSHNGAGSLYDRESPSSYSHIQKSKMSDSEKISRNQSICSRSAIRRLSEVSTAFSEQSSSIRLQWDDPSWDTRSDMISQGVARRCQSPSPSNVSDLSEFRAARKIFDDLTTFSFEDHLGVDEGYRDATPTGDESGSISETHEFIERNCMTDSKHLYRIVSGCSPGSDTFSVSSNLTNRSFQSLRQCAASTSFSNGLLDLTYSPSLSTSAAETFSNSMTDSAISRGSASTGDERWNIVFSNEINSSIRLGSESDDFGTITPCAEDYAATVVFKKRRKNVFCEDRRLFIVRRTDLYDTDFSGTSFRSHTIKKVGFDGDRFLEGSVLFEDFAENETAKVSHQKMTDT